MTAIAPTARAPRPAPRLAPRVSPGQGLRQSFSLAWRTLVSIKHNPTELLDFSIQPVMFVLLYAEVEQLPRVVLDRDQGPPGEREALPQEIGRASCRERVCSVV